MGNIEMLKGSIFQTIYLEMYIQDSKCWTCAIYTYIYFEIIVI